MTSKTMRARDAHNLIGKYVYYVPIINGQHHVSKSGYHHVTGFTRVPTPTQDKIVLHATTGDSDGYWADTNSFCYHDTRDQVPVGQLSEQRAGEPVQEALF